MTNIEPLGSLVLVKKIEQGDRKTSSGLVIASAFSSELTRGIVIALGEGDMDSKGNIHPIPLNEGDTVIYSEGHATEVTDSNNEKLQFINWRNLLGLEK